MITQLSSTSWQVECDVCKITKTYSEGSELVGWIFVPAGYAYKEWHYCPLCARKP